MEKYGTFSDSVSGLNPFLPIWANQKRHVLTDIVKSVFLLPVVVVRVLLLFLLVVWVVAAHTTTSLIPISAIQRPLRLVLVGGACRLMLLVFGIFPIENLADHRRLRIPFSDQTLKFPSAHGDVVFANFTGFVEVLYLQMRIVPMFAIPHADGSVSLLNFFSAIRHSFRFNVLEGSGEFLTLRDIQQHAMSKRLGPVVVFPEGMKSNGTCILKWGLSVAGGYSKTDRELFERWVTIVTCHHRLTGRSYGAPHTVGSPISHILRMCFQLTNPVDVIWGTQEQVADVLRSQTRPITSLTQTLDLLRQTQHRLLSGVQLVDVEGKQLLPFVKYFEETQRKKYA